MKSTLWHFLICFLIVFSSLHASAAAIPIPPLLDDMTWMEVRDAIKAGKTTVIIPTGGSEQNGPHLAIGKHNYIISYTSLAIAQRLGDALAAPVIPFVPEGSISPPEGHMRFAGTISMRPETFAAVLEDTARSLKQNGFKTICFIGEHGGSQDIQKQVAGKLSEEWKAEHVRVLHINEYYDNGNGQILFLKQQGQKEKDPLAHGGLADTSELLAMHQNAVRKNLIGSHTPEDYNELGVAGNSGTANTLLGAKLIDLKVDAAVRQIKRLQTYAPVDLVKIPEPLMIPVTLNPKAVVSP